MKRSNFINLNNGKNNCRQREIIVDVHHKLLESIRLGRFIHADETGWKINGDNHRLRKFSNKKISISHIDKSRGQGVVEKILGNKYKGVLISDFLSAYNKLTAKAKQRCLVHIGRDLDKVMEYWQDDNEVMRYCQRSSKICPSGRSLKTTRITTLSQSSHRI